MGDFDFQHRASELTFHTMNEVLLPRCSAMELDVILI